MSQLFYLVGIAPHTLLFPLPTREAKNKGEGYMFLFLKPRNVPYSLHEQTREPMLVPTPILMLMQASIWASNARKNVDQSIFVECRNSDSQFPLFFVYRLLLIPFLHFSPSISIRWKSEKSSERDKTKTDFFPTTILLYLRPV